MNCLAIPADKWLSLILQTQHRDPRLPTHVDVTQDDIIKVSKMSEYKQCFFSFEFHFSFSFTLTFLISLSF